MGGSSFSDKSIASKVDDDTAASDCGDIYDVPKLMMKLLLMTAVVNDTALPKPLLVCQIFCGGGTIRSRRWRYQLIGMVGDVGPYGSMQVIGSKSEDNMTAVMSSLVFVTGVAGGWFLGMDDVW